MQNFPEITTPRLILNQPVESDRENLLLYLNETPEFAENTLTMPFPYTDESADFWFKLAKEGFENRDGFIFAIREKSTKKLIGGIGLHLTPQHKKAEVGYWLAKPLWNKGYVTEALGAVLKFGFEEVNLNKIYATYYAHNPASGKVMEKCGMKNEALLKDEYLKNGKFLDVNRFCILHSDFFDLQ